MISKSYKDKHHKIYHETVNHVPGMHRFTIPRPRTIWYGMIYSMVDDNKQILWNKSKLDLHYYISVKWCKKGEVKHLDTCYRAIATADCILRLQKCQLIGVWSHPLSALTQYTDWTSGPDADFNWSFSYIEFTSHTRLAVHCTSSACSTSLFRQNVSS